MQLMPHIENLRQQLLAAAETGSVEAKGLAERLAPSLDVAARLAMLEALSDAADEITAELAPGSVEVRLRGRDPTFVVTPPFAGDVADATYDVSSPPPPPVPASDPGEGSTARITLRVPEQTKTQIEAAAAGEGLSVNAWLSRAVGAALTQPPAPDAQRRAPGRPGIDHWRSRTNQRFSGWVR